MTSEASHINDKEAMLSRIAVVTVHGSGGVTVMRRASEVGNGMMGVYGGLVTPRLSGLKHLTVFHYGNCTVLYFTKRLIIKKEETSY